MYTLKNEQCKMARHRYLNVNMSQSCEVMLIASGFCCRACVHLHLYTFLVPFVREKEKLLFSSEAVLRVSQALCGRVD